MPCLQPHKNVIVISSHNADIARAVIEKPKLSALGFGVKQNFRLLVDSCSGTEIQSSWVYIFWLEGAQSQTIHVNCKCGFVLHGTNLPAWLGHPWQKSRCCTSMSPGQGLGSLAGMEEPASGLAFWCHPQNHRITESQNHRIVGVGRDLCGSSSPTPLPKQGHLQ